MVTRSSAAIWFLACFFTVLTACGSPDDTVVDVDLELPADWESVIDMDALGAPSTTPYIGTIRFIYGSTQGEYRDFPYSRHSASIDTGGTDDLTVQALTAGQVIMEGSVSGLKSHSGGVTVSLVKANGFSEAGSLLYPRQNHSAVLVDGVIYILGGNTGTKTIEAVAGTADSFVSSAYAASLVYPRGETTALHDTTGNRLFVFKGASAVDDNLYEIVDFGSGVVIPRTLTNPRYHFHPNLIEQEIFLFGGDDGVSTWFDNTLIIDSQNLNEYIWTGLGSSLVRDNPTCLSDNNTLSCFGGGTDTIEVFNLISGGIDHSLAVFPDMTGFTASLLESTDIVIVGGLEGLISHDIVKLFKPSSGNYSDLGSGINYARYLHTATLINDEEVLIIGGGPTVETSHTAEILNLTTGESTLLPWRMKVPRVGHTATLLPDGRVLVAGGSATDRTVEVFNPRSGL